MSTPTKRAPYLMVLRWRSTLRKWSKRGLEQSNKILAKQAIPTSSLPSRVSRAAWSQSSLMLRAILTRLVWMMQRSWSAIASSTNAMAWWLLLKAVSFLLLSRRNSKARGLASWESSQNQVTTILKRTKKLFRMLLKTDCNPRLRLLKFDSMMTVQLTQSALQSAEVTSSLMEMARSIQSLL